VRSSDIRKAFLDYFAGQGHTVVSSSSLVPDKDPTLLFVNAGMVQFKNLFLGIETRDYARATSCQKCVRAGGKHNDLENVGKTLRHHTFFEMLGNFSFGDYFKEDAIAYAWKLLRNVFGIDEKRMWITVYTEDSDAAAIWRKIGVREDRIVAMGEKDNFWSMGDEGPCGPCSEILVDLGEHVGCGLPSCRVGCDCDRFLEIWNLVFMEFERGRDGRMTRLPRPSIDTGMGLERIASVLQGKQGNYGTDLFSPILKGIEDLSHSVYGEDLKTDIAMRVIADHARGATFIINEGVLPSKDGRGYVLRRIIRRALRYGKKLGIDKEFLCGLSSAVVDIMGHAYPDIKNNHPYIVRVIKGEEERFLETLGAGMRSYEEIAEEIEAKGENTIPGGLVYKLYDTYGFPMDITREMAEEDGLLVDLEGFDHALKQQKARSRFGSKIKGETLDQGHVAVLKEGITGTFVGYAQLRVPAAIITALVKDGALVPELKGGEEGEVFFDITPFYAESGGQVEDRGIVLWPGGKASVMEAKKVKDDLFAHTVKVDEGSLQKGQRVELVVDESRRRGIARNHTATHLLQCALRKVLGEHVKQSGSLVDKDRLRFDFSHFQGMDEEEINEVERLVNEKIMGCFPVEITEKSRDEALREGATALFEEKYGDTVRVARIDDFSTELCGGTHVKNTGEIGSFFLMGESSLASGVRRIEAVTGEGALLYKRKIEEAVKRIARLTNTETDKLQERIEGMIRELGENAKEIARMKEAVTATTVEQAIQEALVKDGARIVSVFVPRANAEDLRRVTDMIRDRVKSCIALVGSQDDGKGLIIVAVSKDMQATYHAGKIIKELTERYGGKGGGGPQIAQGGVPGDRVREALNAIREVLNL
jgi:alanyl-tRNA synthetase